MKPFGPVDNGTQSLYGLDYRMAAWRAGEENPFHTEVGFWLWDAADRAVCRCFMIPRGSTVLAGGVTTPDASSFTMSADVGSETYGILSNPYLEHTDRNRLRRIGYARAQSRVIRFVSRPSSSIVVLPARSAAKNPASFASRA